MSLDDTIRNIVGQVYGNQLVPGLTVAKDVTLVIPPSVYNPATGTTSGDPASETRKAIIREYSLSEVARGNGLLESGDLYVRVLHESGKTIIRPGMNLIIDGVTFRIFNLKTTSLGGQPIQFNLTARK